MSLANKKILITCGPTWTPIDDMRVISNKSTGILGQTLAKALSRAKAKVTILEGPVFRSLESKSIKIIKYCFYDDLLSLIKKELKKKYDVIIHAAAISDYKLKNPYKTKMKSGQKEIKLNLIPTEKIINKFKKISPDSLLVGFKLESSSDKKFLLDKASKLIDKANCDIVIANSLKNNYKGYVVDNNKKVLDSAISRDDLSQKLVSILRKKL